MRSPETIVLHEIVVRAITRRAGADADATVAAVAARDAYDALAEALGPLISQAGVDALVTRALHLTQRKYPSVAMGEEQDAEPFAPVSLWLERLDGSAATSAATEMFSTFASLLAALVGEPLTARYLLKAFPDDSSDSSPEGTQA